MPLLRAVMVEIDADVFRCDGVFRVALLKDVTADCSLEVLVGEDFGRERNCDQDAKKNGSGSMHWACS